MRPESQGPYAKPSPPHSVHINNRAKIFFIYAKQYSFDPIPPCGLSGYGERPDFVRLAGRRYPIKRSFFRMSECEAVLSVLFVRRENINRLINC